jgi:endonuclease/exonuclease/phosphatase family metal-dependent hydrolase
MNPTAGNGADDHEHNDLMVTTESDGKDDDDNDFCQIVDSFGCQAYEKVRRTCPNTTAEDDGAARSWIRKWIRIERGPDPVLLQDYATPNDVLRKIRQVKEVQGRCGLCDLYPRRWGRTPDSEEECDIVVVADESNDESCGVNGAAAAAVDPDLESDRREFTVMQFNSLAEGLSCGPGVKRPFNDPSSGGKGERTEGDKASYGGFSSMPSPDIALDFNLRRWRILEVILGGARREEGPFDLVAMEEVDRHHGFFLPLLRLFGYEGRFVPKTRAPGLFLGWYSDGCSLFWKKSAFTLISEQKREYSVGNQVYMIVTLRHIATGHPVVVAVTHLKAQQGFVQEKVRCHQVDELLDSISKRAQSLLEKREEPVSVLILGDFNADPPAGTGDNGAVSRVLKRDVPTASDSPRSPIRSAYDLAAPGFYTTWKTRGSTTTKRIIDYIFYSGRLRCQATLWVPSESELDPTKLPGIRYPSDHLMIAARFRIDSASK